MCAHRKIVDDIKKNFADLDTEEYHEILEAIFGLIKHRASSRKKTHSLLELKGLGKELWQKVNVEEYLNKERNSWE